MTTTTLPPAPVATDNDGHDDGMDLTPTEEIADEADRQERLAATTNDPSTARAHREAAAALRWALTLLGRPSQAG